MQSMRAAPLRSDEVAEPILFWLNVSMTSAYWVISLRGHDKGITGAAPERLVTFRIDVGHYFRYTLQRISLP